MAYRSESRGCLDSAITVWAARDRTERGGEGEGHIHKCPRTSQLSPVLVVVLTATAWMNGRDVFGRTRNNNMAPPFCPPCLSSAIVNQLQFLKRERRRGNDLLRPWTIPEKGNFHTRTRSIQLKYYTTSPEKLLRLSKSPYYKMHFKYTYLVFKYLLVKYKVRSFLYRHDSTLLITNLFKVPPDLTRSVLVFLRQR